MRAPHIWRRVNAWILAVLAGMVVAVSCNQRGDDPEQTEPEKPKIVVQAPVPKDTGPAPSIPAEVLEKLEQIPSVTADAELQGHQGAELYIKGECSMCHGANLAGKPNLGPPLEGLSQHWDADQLTAYLTNPFSYEGGGERLSALAEEYSLMMRPTRLSADELAILIEWLLAH